jgi:hypothetical protein
MNNIETNSLKHTLPPLPYDYAALEPHIDARCKSVARLNSITSRTIFCTITHRSRRLRQRCRCGYTH